MPYSICRHNKIDRIRCGSPALSGQDFCYFHARYHKRSKAAQASPGLPVSGLNDYLYVAPPDNLPAIQRAISQTVVALAAGKVDVRRATALLEGLRIAAKSCRLQRYAKSMLRDGE